MHGRKLTQQLSSRGAVSRVMLCLCLILASSCVAFRGARIADVPVSKLAVDKPPAFLPALYPTLTMNVEDSSGKSQLAENLVAEDRDYLISLLNKSRMVRLVDRVEDANYQLQVEFMNNASRHSLTWMTLSTITVGIIPYMGNNYYELRASLKNRVGSDIKKYKVEDQTTYWLHIFLAPAMPFYFPTRVQREVRENMYRELVRRLVRDGVKLDLLE